MTNFQIYKASAGSGKTYSLVKEYIKRALSNPDKISHKSLLAITFTNKAASEMKTRIIDSLFHFSNGQRIKDISCQTMYSDLKLELGYNDDQLTKRSKTVLSAILHYYSFFSVSTIDKFIHSILRGFTYELDLPSNFEVELENEKIIHQSVSSLLDDVGIDSNLTTSLINYSAYKIKENKNWDIEKDLFKISKQLFKDDSDIIISNLIDIKKIKETQRKISIYIKHFESKIYQFYVEIKKHTLGIPADVFIYKDLPNYLNKIKQKPYIDIVISKRLTESIQRNNWYKKTETTLNKAKVDRISESLCQTLSLLKQVIDSDYAKYLFYRECYKSLFLGSVLNKINQKINNIKQENNIIHISEFNQIILNFLKESPTPFIFEKAGLRYMHYFIDEFQDTSTIQWNNLVPLLEEALSVGGSCLIVGDGKQSIYRWRGGEVSQFLNLCNIEKSNQQIAFPRTIQSLEKNYRSGTRIVKFNNRFFSFLSKNLTAPYHDLYHKLNQEPYCSKEGYVSLSILDPRELDIVDETLKRIYKYVVDSINSSFLFSDIVVLTRSNKEVAKIAAYLTENGVPIISSESLLLKNSPTVQFIIDNLRIILDESDFLSKAKFLIYLINQNIIELDNSCKHSFVSDVSKTDNRKLENFLISYNIGYSFNKLLRLNIYELAENLIRLFKLDKRPNLYLSFLLDFIFDFSVNQSNSISDFLNFWEQKKETASIVIPPGINAVEIMTIHKSKGLQFPIVIFPFANWKEDLGKDNKWFNLNTLFEDNQSKLNIATLLPLKKELQNWPMPFPEEYLKHKKDVLLDTINLLYVAMTRPKDRLYIISNSDTKKGGVYKYFESFIKEHDPLNTNLDFLSEGVASNSTLSYEDTAYTSSLSFISEPWRARVRIRKNNFFKKKYTAEDSLYWGDLMHEIMENVEKKEDIMLVLSSMKIAEKHGQKTADRIYLQITRIITNKRVAHLFNSNLKVFSETSILSPDGQVYRPDRVVISASNTANLIDYKTGKEKKSDYHQMSEYENILLQLGYTRIKKYLIYLTTGDIKELK